MNLCEDESIKKDAKPCGHCYRKTLLPYEYEWTCISCGFNLIKRKHELTKIQKKINSYQSPKICRTQNSLHMRRCI